MKYLKLFESYKVDKSEYPKGGDSLSLREKEILKDLVGNYYSGFNIKKDDGYYYTYINFPISPKMFFCFNRFDGFNELKDYIQFNYFIRKNNTNGILALLKKSKIDPSFDKNHAIQFASGKGHTEIVKLLLEDPRVNPSDGSNLAIKMASENGHVEIVKLLLEDPRVDPSDLNNWTIKVASKNKHKEVVKLLIKDKRVMDKLSPKEIKKYTDTGNSLWKYLKFFDN